MSAIVADEPRVIPAKAAGQSWPHWTTPMVVLERVRAVGIIGLDPCSNEASRDHVPSIFAWPGAKAGGTCGLGSSWSMCPPETMVYVNPPYGRQDLTKWVVKMIAEAGLGCEIVALLPSSTGTKWFHSITATAQALHFWGPGRLSFGNAPPGAPGDRPSIDNVLAYWGKRPHRFLDAFSGAGLGVRP